MVWLIWGVAGVVCIGRDSGAGVASNAATAVVPPSMGGVAYGRLGAGPRHGVRAWSTLRCGFTHLPFSN